MRQTMLNKKLIIAALGFSLTAAACGPGGEGAEPQPVTQTSASQALTANAGGMAASLEANLKFLDDSQLFMSAMGEAGSSTCSTTIIDGEEFTDCSESEDPSVADLEIKSGADALIEQLNKAVFVEGNVERAESLKVTYLLKGDVVCPALDLDEEELADCKDMLTKIEVRLAVTSPAQGDVRVDVLIGPDQANPVSFEVFRSSLAAELDFDGVKAAGDHIAKQLGEDAPKMPTTIEGRVRVALKKSGTSGLKGELGILRAIKIDDDAQNIHVALGAANPAASVTIDSAAKTLISQVSMGAIDIEGMVSEEVGEEPTPAPGDGGANDGDTTGGEKTEYTIKAHVAGLTGKATLKAETDAFTLEGLGWGSEAGTLLINGKKVFEALLNPSAGHKFGLTVKPSEQGADIEVTPQLDLSVLLKFGQLDAALLEKLDIDAWMKDDSITVQLASGTKLRAAEGLEVTSGSVTIRSTAADVNVMASAGMCLMPGESEASGECTFDEQLGTNICEDTSDGSDHPLAGLSAGACEQ